MRSLIAASLIGLEIALPTASAVGSNSYAEGVAYTYASGASYQPVETRRLNKTQIFHKTFKVSGTVEAVGKYGRSSEWAFRKTNALRAWKVDVEMALLDNSASGAGASGSARTMMGLRVADGLSATAATSGSAPVDEGNLNVLLQAMWDQGASPDRVLCGAFVKRQISQFAGVGAGRPIIINNGEREFMDVIDVYESDFGRMNIINSRRLNIKSEVLAWQNEMAEIPVLRPATLRPTPNDGDFITGAIVGELTFAYLNANAFGRLRRVQSA